MTHPSRRLAPHAPAHLARAVKRRHGIVADLVIAWAGGLAAMPMEPVVRGLTTVIAHSARLTLVVLGGN